MSAPAIHSSLSPTDLQEALKHRYLSLQIASRQFSGAGDDPSDYFHKSKGTVRLHSAIDDSYCDIGQFAVIQVDLEGAWRSGRTAYDVLDTTGPSFEFFEVLYKDGDYRNAALKALHGYPTGSENILILDRLLVLPAFRGHGLGLEALHLMMQRFSFGTGIIALKAFPLQFESKAGDDPALGLDTFTRNEVQARKKLFAIYRQAGFVAIRGTPYMLRAGELPLWSSSD